MVKIGTYPVYDRHEVIANRLHSGTSQICKAFLVVLYKLFTLGAGILYGFADRETFDDRPAESE